MIFLSKDTSEDNKKFFATCCVIVEAPISLFPEPIFLILVISENFYEVSNSFKLSLNIVNPIAKNNVLPLMTVIGTMFAYFSIVIVNFGDFSRYVKNEEELNKGNISLVINLILFSFH